MTLTQLAQSTRPADALVASLAAEGSSTVVALRGEADLFTLPVLVDVLARVTADHDGPVIIDLAGSPFIDTGGIRTVARAANLPGRPRPRADPALAIADRGPNPDAPRALPSDRADEGGHAMTAALLVGAGVIIGAFVMLYATTLLDRVLRASTSDRSEPLTTALDHITAVVTAEPAVSPANSTIRNA